VPIAEELLQLARSMVQNSAASQAALRRAASTAYYALFHLLIDSATQNWAQPDLRPELRRLFQHGRMKSAASELIAEVRHLRIKGGGPGANPTTFTILEHVADTFVNAQQKREEADYDMGTNQWTVSEVSRLIDEIDSAFHGWNIVRVEPRSQKFLLHPVGKRQ
jgi:uncharacterized protein (UPF0332 family)